MGQTRETGKVTGVFSGPLFGQNLKANWALCLVIAVIMVLMCVVMNFAGSMMSATAGGSEDYSEEQEEFYVYLGALAAYDAMTQANLSYGDFAQGGDRDAYEQAFNLLSQSIGEDLSVQGFQEAIDDLGRSDVPLDDYVRQFEYAYALAQSTGVFSGDELDLETMMDTMLGIAGVDMGLMDTMEEMDPDALLNSMYFTGTGLLPVFLLVVLLANSLVVDKVDRGSMAYLLSTPTKRRAVAFTQMLFMLVVPLVLCAIACVARIASTNALYPETNAAGILALYVGMYLLVEAVAGLCYFGSCVFNRSGASLAFGGGLAVWFFLASLLGIFGSPNLVDIGMGVEALGVFNNLTLVGLYDTDALATVGTAAVDYAFAWKLRALAGVAAVAYVAGAVRFCKRDLPL